MPEEPLRRYAEERSGQGFGIAALVEPDHDLVEGVTIDSDLGPWQVYETPGHAPSHVCLFQPERRLLISGDHLLGRVSLYYDYGWTPDPAGEFLESLDKVGRAGRPAVPVGPREAVHATSAGTSRPTASWSPSASRQWRRPSHGGSRVPWWTSCPTSTASR